MLFRGVARMVMLFRTILLVAALLPGAPALAQGIAGNGGSGIGGNSAQGGGGGVPATGGSYTGAVNFNVGLGLSTGQSIKWNSVPIITQGTRGTSGTGTLGDGPSFFSGLGAGNAAAYAGSWVVGTGFNALHVYGGGGESICNGALCAPYATSGLITGTGMHAVGEETTPNITADGNDCDRNGVGSLASVCVGTSALRNGTEPNVVAVGNHAAEGNSALLTVNGTVAPGNQVTLSFSSTNPNVVNVPFSITVTSTGSTDASYASDIINAITATAVASLPQDAYVFLQAGVAPTTGSPTPNIVEFDFGGTPTAGWAMTITATPVSGLATFTVGGGSGAQNGIAVGTSAAECVYCGPGTAVNNFVALGPDTVPWLQSGIDWFAGGALAGYNSQTSTKFTYTGEAAAFSQTADIEGSYYGFQSGYGATGIANSVFGADDSTYAISASCIGAATYSVVIGRNSCLHDNVSSYQFVFMNALYGSNNSGQDNTRSNGCIGVYNQACAALLDVEGKDTLNTTLVFRVENSTPTNAFYVTDAAEVVAGTGGTQATTATTGFFHFAGMAGPPTGTPANIINDACTMDTTDQEHDCYMGSSWYHSPMYPGTLGLPLYASATKTANFTIPATASGTHYDNSGASGSVTLTLPAAAANLNYCFAVYTAQTLEILGAGTDQIALGGVGETTSENITSATQWSDVCLEAHGTGQWIAQNYAGTWAVH